MKLNRYTLKKIETIFEEMDYELIYEKGSFKSGYCIVEQNKVIVINKFFDVEARINCLIDIMDSIELDVAILSKESQKFHKRLLHESFE